jgi:hypothetical protein
MAIFNQQGQSVGYQFNGETFHFDSARSIPAAVSELEKLLSELSTAGASGPTGSNTVEQAQAKVAEAVAAAKGPNPEKSKVAGYLSDAANLLQTVTSLSGLAGAVANAATMVWRLF